MPSVLAVCLPYLSFFLLQPRGLHTERGAIVNPNYSPDVACAAPAPAPVASPETPTQVLDFITSAAKSPTQRIEEVLKMKKVTKPMLLILAGRRGLRIENAVTGQGGLKAEPLRLALTNGLGLAHTPVSEWCQNIRAMLSSGDAAALGEAGGDDVEKDGAEGGDSGAVG